MDKISKHEGEILAFEAWRDEMARDMEYRAHLREARATGLLDDWFLCEECDRSGCEHKVLAAWQAERENRAMEHIAADAGIGAHLGRFSLPEDDERADFGSDFDDDEVTAVGGAG